MGAGLEHHLQLDHDGPVKVGSYKTEKMERETGLEPVTSSLGRRQ